MDQPKIIFEDDNLLVVHKPAGLLVHSDNTDITNTLVEWYLNYYPAGRGVGEPRIGKDGQEIERSGIVHRLDRDTSGIILIAKTQLAFDALKSQFKDRLVQKEYRALVYGKMKDKWGTINRVIGRSVKDWKLRSAERGAKGRLREAVTEWQCLESGTYMDEDYSYLTLKPKTGRMHQLRVHLKSISRPIVGDNLYAKPQQLASSNLGLTRLALHSFSIKFLNLGNEEVYFEDPLPSDFEAAVQRIA